MRLLVVPALTLPLVGCLTVPIATEQARPVTPAAFSAPSAGAGTVIVKRDAGMYGSGCATKVTVNGKDVAVIGQGEKVTLYLPTGEAILGAGPTGNGICVGVMREQAVNVSAGQTVVFRVAIDHSTILFQRTQE